MSDMFTERDLEQEADTSAAKTIEVSDGQDVSISEEGVYVLKGAAKEVTVTVNADDAAKVQLVLDGLNITNSDSPAIYVVSADKVFVTTADGSTNELSVTGSFAAVDAETNVDGVIFAKDDICFNGKGTLTVSSSANGIVGKDDVKFTGGAYKVDAQNHAIQGKDSVRVASGTIDLKAAKDGIHAENSDDQTLGYVFIKDGTFNIQASSDGIEGDAVVQIDGGTFNITSEEGIEGTYVQVNGGVVKIDASDDGINSTSKSNAYDAVLQINGGDITINMGAGDTDALDANGSLIINGGTVDITAQSAFDFDGQGMLNGGTVTVNGEQVTELTNSMMGGHGGFGNPAEGSSGMSPKDFSGEMPEGFSGKGPRGSHGPMGGNSGNSGAAPDMSTQSA